MITVERDFENNDSLANNWCDLFNNSFEATIFQSYSFNRIVWEELKGTGELFIIVVAHNNTGEYLALFPCYTDKKCLKFINERDSDFCGPLFRKGHEHNYSLSEEIASFFQSAKVFNRIVFSNIIAQNPVLTNYAPFLKEMVSYPMNHYSYFQIEPFERDISFIEKLDQIENAIDRNRLKKLERKTECLRLEVFQKSDSKEYPESIVSSLVKIMIDNGVRTGDYLNHNYLSVFRNLYNNGILLIAVTWNNNEPVSLSMSLTCPGKEIIQWVALYKEKQYNIYNVLQLVKYLYKAGGDIRFNFARGIYEYKLRNFRPVMKTLYCLRYSKTRCGELRDVFASSFMQAKPILKSIFRR